MHWNTCDLRFHQQMSVPFSFLDHVYKAHDWPSSCNILDIYPISDAVFDLSLRSCSSCTWELWKTKQVQTQSPVVSTALMKKRWHVMTPCCLRTQWKLHHMHPFWVINSAVHHRSAPGLAKSLSICREILVLEMRTKKAEVHMKS